MDLEDMARIVSRGKLIQSGYVAEGNYMLSEQQGKVYRFILATNNEGYIFDGVEDVGSEQDKSKTEVRKVRTYDNS